MMPIKASHLLIVDGIEEDPNTKARADRMRAFIDAGEVLHMDDAEFDRLVDELNLYHGPKHGMHTDHLPVVIFNRFRFDESEEAVAERRREYPNLFRGRNYAGYSGFDWRGSGTPKWRQETGCVCVPAWQIHTIVGCPFRCAYCGLGHVYNIMMNMEDLVGRLDGLIEKTGDQTLFQFDNGTDTACFEPEYGGSRLLIEYFAHKPQRYLELYVGKSDNVDSFLDLDHREKTVACWSLAGPTQSTLFEPVAADWEGRIEAIRKMQQAGYPVRVRFSPIIPVKNWEEENRQAIRRLFELTAPDVITIETLRFLDYGALEQYFDLSLLDEEWLEIMRECQGQEVRQGGEIPDEYRWRVYRFMIDEIGKVSPETPIAFCREARAGWDRFAADLAPLGQDPDHYICNCGPYSHPGQSKPFAPHEVPNDLDCAQVL